ncbi:branched-chain amino acid ABC transporter permease [Phycicoccus endophyticus]|uniref:Branched-chain amino acid ABC transporter permease n=1 Tax=Phycicoccus endophyticus TaxID=1690220 RepID=A0A7G9QZC7_9MICO|nr:branched-chain amino acid ABC transporter permease [Phycicoccus endophyticus]NHI19057.1 branched-chain amino acid ABC transporter permease [Phycicoccus endophyticus]QNN48702.1 branched-chain amino acid ABC transporter permease [Phycicoccus endophyticus]GGL32524.1 branched-chain amino acid ABC transporter permease [Phycicoccus endophyticus]
MASTNTTETTTATGRRSAGRAAAAGWSALEERVGRLPGGPSLGMVLSVTAFLVLAVAGLAIQENFWLRVLTLGFLFTAVAQSWNLMAGYAGQWSLAQLAFFGVGAYSAGILQQELDVPLLLGIVPAMVVTVFFAVVVGYVTLRLRGHYFSVLTFFLVVALYELVRYFADYTGGQYGLTIPFSAEVDILRLQLGSVRAYYFLGLLVAVLSTGALWLVARSQFGLKLRAIRDDQDAAAAVGVAVHKLKVVAMAISAAMAGFAGVVYLATYKLMDSDTAFGVHATLDPVVAGILGGAGQLMGGALGELVLQPVVGQVSRSAGSVPGLTSLVYGLILMLVILFLPKGLLGLGARRFARRGRVARAPVRATTTDPTTHPEEPTP